MTDIGPNTRPLDGPAPKLKAPKGAVDCHTHFYLPGHAGQPGGPAIAEFATVEDYRIVQRRLGFERVVLSQANAYQFDNGSILAALDQFGKDKARAVVAVHSDTSSNDLKSWTERGACGARIMNLRGGATPIRHMKPVEAKIRDFGWHLMVQFNGRELPELFDQLHAIEANYMIDHIGKFIDPVPADDPRVDMILRLIDKGNAWFKIAGINETSLIGAPGFDDVAAIARRVINHAPERIVWGSNWPHSGSPRSTYPDDAVLLDSLLDLASSEQQRLLLTDNPEAFYRFR